MNLRFRPVVCPLGFVALMFLVLSAPPSHAADWVECVRDNSAAITWYYDAESLRIDKNLLYVWFKLKFAKPLCADYLDACAADALFHDAVDCSSQTIAHLESTYYDQHGKVLRSVPRPSMKFEALIPDSSGWAAAKAVCGLRTPKEETPRAKEGHTQTKNTSTVGSGLVVSSDGLVLTNAHVVPGCEAIRVTTASGERRAASLAATDPQSDLALLRTKGSFSSVAGFRTGRPVRLGEDVVALGYPLHGLLASGVNVSSGTVSALAGIANDSTKLQISAPVQPGNSGGPLLDLSGTVVGIVVAKLDAIKMAAAIGDIPQNVNFAIKADVARLFLEGQGVSLQLAQPSAPRKREDVAAIGREFTVLVECLNGPGAK